MAEPPQKFCQQQANLNTGRSDCVKLCFARITSVAAPRDASLIGGWLGGDGIHRHHLPLLYQSTGCLCLCICLLLGFSVCRVGFVCWCAVAPWSLTVILASRWLGNMSRGTGVMGRMKPSPKEEGPAKWLSRLKRFANNKQILTRVGVIASSLALRELLRWLVHVMRH